MGRGLRIIQITEEDKIELAELGREALDSMYEFLECLDDVTDGQISDEMKKRFSERRGVPGSGRGRSRYSRRMGERRGVPGTGRYGRREGGGSGGGGSYGQHYSEDEEYEERGGEGGYGNRYDY